MFQVIFVCSLALFVDCSQLGTHNDRSGRCQQCSYVLVERVLSVGLRTLRGRACYSVASSEFSGAVTIL